LTENEILVEFAKDEDEIMVESTKDEDEILTEFAECRSTKRK
jgi:hypothetical protein